MNIVTENNLDRREQIVDAAYQCFLTYGYKRVSMDDIAVAAGLSRPALYNHFRNKAEIFRACFTRLTGLVAERAAEAADAGETLHGSLVALLMTGFIEPHREFGQMPHGAELLGLKSDLAADLLADWFTVMERHAARIIGRHAPSSSARPNPGPDEAARLLIHAIEGIKARCTSVEDAERDMLAMVNLFVAALEG